jgi:hypothetical protein
MKKILILVLIFTISCAKPKINERVINREYDLIDVKVDDEGDWHFISNIGTFTDINDGNVYVQRTGSEMKLVIKYYTWDNNPNSPWLLYPYGDIGSKSRGIPYHITVPKGYKIEIFND